MQFGGLGQLCDGVLGGDDFMETKELRVWPGYDYLGWSREALGQGSVDIEFHFEKPRVFHSMQVGRESVCCIGSTLKGCRVACKSDMSARLAAPVTLRLCPHGDHFPKQSEYLEFEICLL